MMRTGWPDMLTWSRYSARPARHNGRVATLDGPTIRVSSRAFLRKQTRRYSGSEGSTKRIRLCFTSSRR